jgi:uncharacterized membrane protein
MTDFMQGTFSLVCGQNPLHTWYPGGAPLPFCQRCTGLYTGAAIAFLLLCLFRPQRGARYRWLHGMLLLLMTPFGFHLVPQDAFLRTLSGEWFGFGVVGLLWLQPAAKWRVPANRVASGGKLHLLIGAMSLILLPALARWGGGFAAAMLPWLAFAGLGTLTGLLLANVFVFVSYGVARSSRQTAGADL